MAYSAPSLTEAISRGLLRLVTFAAAPILLAGPYGRAVSCPDTATPTRIGTPV